MANTLNLTDIYAIVNKLKNDVLGVDAPSVTDTTSLVTVGENMVRAGIDSTFKAISDMWGRTIFASRPYTGRYRSIASDDATWGAQLRKISYLTVDAEPSSDWNTDINYTQLDDGNSIDMYRIHKPKPVQLVFPGMKTSQFSITRFENQMLEAFQSERQFMDFYDGAMVEFNNDIEQSNEATREATLLNYIAGVISMEKDGTRAVNLRERYNTEYGTSYSVNELLTTHLDSFMKFITAKIRLYSLYLATRTTKWHFNPTSVGNIPRYTSEERQKMFMNADLFKRAEANVYSSTFNPKFLEIGDFEEVAYWQFIDNPTAINIKPNVMNLETGVSEDAAAAVNESYIVGVLIDEDAVSVNRRFDGAYSTPFNARGRYSNLFIHQVESFYNDFTENGIVFYIA